MRESVRALGDFTVECLELPEDVLFEDGEAEFNVDVVVGLSLERCFKGGDDGDDLGGDGGIAAVGEQIVDVGRIGVEGSGRVWYGSGRHVKTSGRGVDVFAAPVVVEAGSGFFDCWQCTRPFDGCQVDRMNCLIHLTYGVIWIRIGVS